MNNAQFFLTQLKELADPVWRERCKRFFRTQPGEYAEHDCFLGISVPKLRIIAIKYLPLFNQLTLTTLLNSTWHEARMLALIALLKHPDSLAAGRFYLAHLTQINNWDLVDISAPTLLGTQLTALGGEALLLKLLQQNLWAKRIAVVATLGLIRQGDCQLALKIAERLLASTEKILQQAIGWVLREVGKQNEALLITFLTKNLTRCPRITLRYAIEKFKPNYRHQWLTARTWSNILAQLQAGILIWHIPVTETLLNFYQPFLTSAELQTLAYKKTANTSILAHGALKAFLSRFYHQSPLSFALTQTTTGKLTYPGPLYFNLSHSKAWIVIAFALSPIGVDLECQRALTTSVKLRIFPLFPHLTDRSFFQYWTAREATLKAAGLGIWQTQRTFKLFPQLFQTQLGSVRYFYQPFKTINHYVGTVSSTKKLALFPMIKNWQQLFN